MTQGFAGGCGKGFEVSRGAATLNASSIRIGSLTMVRVPLASACCILLAAAAPAAQSLDIDGAKVPFTPEGKPLQGLVVVVDPAGGGSGVVAGELRAADGGAGEWNLNLLVASSLRHHLADAGAKVYLTRFEDLPVGTEERRRTVLDARPHLAITVRHAPSDVQASGGVALTLPSPEPLTTELADIVNAEVAKLVPPHKAPESRPAPSPDGPPPQVPVVRPWFGSLADPAFGAWASRRGAHTEEARAAYDGIVCAWKQKHGDLERLRAANFPESASPTDAATSSPDDWRTRAVAFQKLHPGVKGIAQELWRQARPPATAAEAQQILDIFSRRVLTDASFLHLRPRVERRGAEWVLGGTSNYAFLTTAAAQLLTAVGCEPLQNRIEQLPSARLGAMRCGVVKVPMAMTWGSPREGDDVQTQLLLGERVFLLDESPDRAFLLLHGGDGYVGWVRAGAVKRMDEEEFSFWENAPRVTITRDYVASGLRIPAAAALPLASRRTGPFDLKLPEPVAGVGNAGVVEVPADCVQLPSADKPGDRAARAAAEFLTVPYVFGGRSRVGLDCSGLTGNAWAAAGVTLPRDARQQVIVGKMVATPWHLPDLRPGDLLFFCDESGKVMHVAVSVGGKRFLHASPPEVQLSSYDPGDPLYTALWHKHFAFARRPVE
jgi:N-acetylmuramoyl-L-alanine amidase